MADALIRMQAEVGRHLKQCEKLFVPGAIVTFIARFPDDPEGRCDVLIGNDDLGELAKLIQRASQLPVQEKA